jgi:hypothetical protein
MASIPTPPLALSQVGRAAHDLGMAGIMGGNLFARFALHPAVTHISDKRERGEVINAAWRRYGTINSLSLAAILAAWAGARADEARPSRLSGPERRLAVIKDSFVAATALTGIAAAVEGIRFARQEPAGAVPLEDGDRTAPEATAREAELKRRLNVLGLANLAAGAGLVAVNAALAQENFRRPPGRRRVLLRFG